jgi:uncharacterized protein (UPF0332 family)
MVKQPQTTDEYLRAKIAEYLTRAHRVLKTRNLALADEDYITAVNRAYYAIFYSANALLTTKGLERSKHSGVIAAFRQHFVKTGVIEPEYSDFYGSVMENRHSGDYTLVSPNYDAAHLDLQRAKRLLARVERVLQEQGWI